jgi:hypothetical protein
MPENLTVDPDGHCCNALTHQPAEFKMRAPQRLDIVFAGQGWSSGHGRA